MIAIRMPWPRNVGGNRSNPIARRDQPSVPAGSKRAQTTRLGSVVVSLGRPNQALQWSYRGWT
jgi:hypothetical protein